MNDLKAYPPTRPYTVEDYFRELRFIKRMLWLDIGDYLIDSHAAAKIPLEEKKELFVTRIAQMLYEILGHPYIECQNKQININNDVSELFIDSLMYDVLEKLVQEDYHSLVELLPCTFPEDNAIRVFIALKQDYRVLEYIRLNITQQE